MIQHMRSKSSLLASIWVIGVVTLVTLTAQTPGQIHPATPQNPERPIVIAVLSDGFTDAQKADFNDAAANFFTYGLLLDPDYEPHKDRMTIKTWFKAVANAGDSQFGFTLGTGVTNCSVSWNISEDATGTTAMINAVLKDLGATHAVVIANHNYNFGCSHDIWTYVAVGAVGEPILEHEFGHLLAGLKDEYVIDEFENQQYPESIDKKNCSTTSPPYWVGLGLQPAPGTEPGCGLYGLQVVHAYKDCKMGLKGARFCALCNREMQLTWDFDPTSASGNTARLLPAHLPVMAAGFFGQQPSPPPAVVQAAQPQLRLLLSVNQQSKSIKVISADDVNGPIVNRQRVVGDYVYEVNDGANVIAVGVIPGDPFMVHGYRGGGTQHARVPGDANATATASVVVNVAGVTRDDIAKTTRSIAIDIWKLGPQVRVPSVDTAVWSKLKTGNQVSRIAQLGSAQLREFIVPVGKVARPPAKDDRRPVRK
jgi:hypothetical protein